MINKEQALTELKATEERLKELRKIIEAPEKPSAEEWLREFIKQPFTVKHTDGYITYYLEDQWIFQQDLENQYLWCYYYSVWKVLSDEYKMSYGDIQTLMKNVVNEAFNCNGFTPKNNELKK